MTRDADGLQVGKVIGTAFRLRADVIHLLGHIDAALLFARLAQASIPHQGQLALTFPVGTISTFLAGSPGAIGEGTFTGALMIGAIPRPIDDQRAATVLLAGLGGHCGH
jgi:hypothetical protein